MVTRFISLLALFLVVGACELRADASLTINEDQTGTFGFEASLDEELRDLLAQQGQEVDLAAQLGDLPAGWTTESFVEGDFEGVRASRTFDSFGDLQRSLDDLAGSDFAGQVNVTDFLVDLKLARDGDRFEFAVTIGDVSGSFAGALAGGGLEGIDVAGLFDTILNLKLIVTLPGEVVEHNGDGLDGSTVSWTLDLDTSGQTLMASSEVAGSGQSFAVVGGMVAAIGLFTFGFLMVKRRNENRAREFVAAAGE